MPHSLAKRLPEYDLKRRRRRRGHPAIVPAGNIDTTGLTKGHPEYDDSQPRAADGTWSSGGGGSPAPASVGGIKPADFTGPDAGNKWRIAASAALGFGVVAAGVGALFIVTRRGLPPSKMVISTITTPSGNSALFADEAGATFASTVIKDVINKLPRAHVEALKNHGVSFFAVKNMGNVEAAQAGTKVLAHTGIAYGYYNPSVRAVVVPSYIMYGGKPVGLNAAAIEKTLLHEIGHALDSKGLGAGYLSREMRTTIWKEYKGFLGKQDAKTASAIQDWFKASYGTSNMKRNELFADIYAAKFMSDSPIKMFIAESANRDAVRKAFPQTMKAMDTMDAGGKAAVGFRTSLDQMLINRHLADPASAGSRLRDYLRSAKRDTSKAAPKGPTQSEILAPAVARQNASRARSAAAAVNAPRFKQPRGSADAKPKKPPALASGKKPPAPFAGTKPTFGGDKPSYLKGEPEFNPDQPRAADGTWTAGGASASVSIGVPHKDLGSVSVSLSSISNKAEATRSIRQINEVHEKMRQLPTTAWRDPTALDHAWKGYLTTVASLAALAAVTVTLGGVFVAGSLIAGAHVSPTHSAIGAGLMALFPKGYTSFSYTVARRYLSTLFPKEAVAARAALSAVPMVGAGIAGLGAMLATAMALRYAYREYETNGRYEGVSSINRRIELLDQHIDVLTSAISGRPTVTPEYRSTFPYVQSGLALGASLVALAGAAKLGMMAYRVSKLPPSALGAFSGWKTDVKDMARDLGADISRAARAARRKKPT